VTKSATSAGRRFAPGALLFFLATTATFSTASADSILASRAAIRAQSLAVLSGGGSYPADCLTPLFQSVRQDPAVGTVTVRRALALLQSESSLLGERRIADRDGTVIRYSVDRTSPDRVDPTDSDGDGQPDVVEAVLDGLAATRRLFVDQMGLTAPGPTDVVLARLGGGVDGYLVPPGRRDGRPLLMIEAAPRGGAGAARNAAMHQFAHATLLAAGPAVPAAFGEAIATWAVLKIAGGPEGRVTARLAERLSKLDAGLETDDLALAAGNAAWFAFLDEAYGLTAVGLSIEELSTGAPTATALDRALRRAVGEPFTSAFRDFHLWSVLTGGRADGRHFSFADRLPSPSFADTVEGLPALSVQADPPVSPLGAAHVLFRPSENRGGMNVRFEGEVGSRWEADLLLTDPFGRVRRLALPLTAEARGEVTVPLNRVAEAILLVRNLDGEGRSPRRYTWSAHRDPGYPCEISAVDVRDADSPAGGVLVAWETASESALAGFNVLRRREGARGEIRINPIWVPSLGDSTTPAAYQFLDTTAAPGVRYLYRIEAVTPEGLSGFSESIASGPAAPAR
jgi:hypothetical protein